MRGGLRSPWAAVGPLVIVLALAGCAGKSWQFWKSSEATETASDPALASTPPAPATEAAAPAPAPAPTAAPAGSTEPVVAAAPSADGLAELPVLPEVRFRSGQVRIGKADVKALDVAVRWLEEHPDAQVVIEGHTDDLGTPQANLVVGERRATSIMRHLIARGIDPGRLSVVSAGSDRPLCAEKTTTCRAKNRRARLLVKQR